MHVQYPASMRREDRHQSIRGRGAVTNPGGRFEGTRLEAADDGWGSLDEPPRRPDTLILADRPRRAISRNASPDVPFDQSVNPYQGCEHDMWNSYRERGRRA